MIGRPSIKIGTRASHLALAQTELFVNELSTKCDADIEIISIETQGDKKQEVLDRVIRDKRDWILEIEQAVVNGKVDLAVHSAKDVPAQIQPDTVLIPVLKRESPFDVFIGQAGQTGPGAFFALPDGAQIGTSSLRRQAQLLRLRPDLRIVEHRGNVQTRIEKLKQMPNLAGIVLARAGLARLGLEKTISYLFSANELLPAVNQGTLVVQCLANNEGLRKIIGRCVDADNLDTFKAERACIETLQADCNSAVGVYGLIANEVLTLKCRVLSTDGQQVVEKEFYKPRQESVAIGRALARIVLESGGQQLLRP